VRNWHLFWNALHHVISMALLITVTIWFIDFFFRNGGLSPDPPPQKHRLLPQKFRPKNINRVKAKARNAPSGSPSDQS
jgi:hypothetical protein